jgi:hypothetical protein
MNDKGAADNVWYCSRRRGLVERHWTLAMMVAFCCPDQEFRHTKVIASVGVPL